jgi:hypothetical protein
MDFYISLWWYVFVGATFIASFLQFFGFHNNGTKSKQVDIYAGIAIWGILIASFFFVGWIGGLVLLVLYFLFIGRLAHRCSYFVFKLLRPNAKYLTYKIFKLKDTFREKETEETDFSFESIQKYGEEKELYLSRAKQNHYVINYLNQLGEDESKIDEIYDSLIMSGGGKYTAFVVINSPHLLKEYIELENRGHSKRDIAYNFFEGLGA